MAFNFSPKVVTDGLVLYLDAANPKSYISGATAWNDISRGGNDGVLINGPSFSNSNGGCLVFDGVNEYIQAATSSGSELTGNLTYGIWAKRNGTNSSGLNGLISNEWHIEFTGIGIYLRNTDNQITVESGNGTTRISYNMISTVSNRNWTYYTLVVSSPNVLVYVNGILLDTRVPPSSTIMQNPIRPIAIARWAPSYNSYYLNGEVANAKVYSRDLTPEEILQNYNATKSRFGL
jgi:hypothetical protein